MAGSETTELLETPRDSTVRPLLFAAVSNASGQDTQLAIANTSVDPFGTTPASGSCTVNFYGSNAPAPLYTGNIAAGTMWTGLASAIAPGFQGYAIATCTFPHARGRAYVSDAAFRNDGDTVPVEVIAQPRSTATSSLLFSAVSSFNTQDTGFTISNTSLDPFGTAARAGACRISYFGDVQGSSGGPPPQTSTAIPPGGQLTFSLSAGNPAQGILPTPGFHGYVQVDCGFPLARGVATTTGTQGGPLTCSAQASSPAVRGEGMTELIGDLLITCNGGVTPAAGTAIPTADITVSLGTTGHKPSSGEPGSGQHLRSFAPD